jgi:hypothetical protein
MYHKKTHRVNGKIPGSIGELKRIEELHLNHNNMYGELPSTLCNCTNLITIDLKGNNFSGELHKVNFFNLHNLRTLDLPYNNFIGTVPESIYSFFNERAQESAYFIDKGERYNPANRERESCTIQSRTQVGQTLGTRRQPKPKLGFDLNYK